MRIAELSERTGVSPPTIKFYAREGLLPPAHRSGYNQVDYTEAHVRRLRLIRALIDVGGLAVATVRSVIEAVDDPAVPLEAVLGTTQRATPRGSAPVAPPSPSALAAVTDLVVERGWTVGPDNRGIAQAAAVLDGWAALDRKDLFASLGAYARAAELVAAADLDRIDADAAADDRDRSAETVVVGSVLGDALLAGLRRIAQEHESRTRYAGRGTPTTATGETP